MGIRGITRARIGASSLEGREFAGSTGYLALGSALLGLEIARTLFAVSLPRQGGFDALLLAGF
jgi:hypothetical protein